MAPNLCCVSSRPQEIFGAFRPAFASGGRDPGQDGEPGPTDGERSEPQTQDSAAIPSWSRFSRCHRHVSTSWLNV